MSNQGKAITSNTTAFTTEWTRMGFVFVPDERLSYEYLIFGIGYGITSGDAVSQVYIDNVNITEFTAKMYIKDTNGDYTYYNLNTASYREVKTAYRVYGSVSDAEWVTY